MFESSVCRRIRLSPLDSSPGSVQGLVKKVIDPTYVEYQTALRRPDDSSVTKHRLIEASLISAALASGATPEAVRRERYATTFPGGISDPSLLQVGATYVEDGLLFVGGERPNDEGFRMMMDVAKGFPVDARAYYGHSGDEDEKMQWLTLPGAAFRYDGTDGQSPPTHLFTQISR